MSEGCQGEIPSSDMAFSVAFGVQIGAQTPAEGIQNISAMEFPAYDDFVQPSNDLGCF